ncbi:enoyl-CoA hydratase/isomerase family protein [bacterium]|nr:enoyl-CoA hydratase/isomerase family protein [bacterium]
MSENSLLKETNNSIGILRFNRPEKRNALSAELLIELHLTLKQWAEDDLVRVVIITGAPDRAFSSGYDISAIPTDLSPEAAELLKTENPLELALSSIRNFPYPVMAMINGYCFGAGLNLAMCCDIRVGPDHIKIGMPPAKLGAVYHPEGLRPFIEVIGMARTREIFFTGHTYKDHETKVMGLVDRLVPADQLLETVMEMASEIAVNAPLSLRGMKKILNMFGDGLQLNTDDRKIAELLVYQSFSSDDLKEGQTAFLEKRKPVFMGK